MLKIVLAGNPNTGKSTLFNNLTRGNAKVGNWHGVTTRALGGMYYFGGENYEITDLPGTYSLRNSGPEEKVTTDALEEKNYDLIINIIEAKNLKRSLRLTTELLKLKKSMIVVINMNNELERRSGYINEKILSEILGVKVYKIEAIEKKQTDSLKKIISEKDFKVSAPVKSSVDEICKISFTPANQSLSRSDKLLLDGRFAFPFFIFITAFIFYMAFGNYGVGKGLSNLTAYLFGVKLKVAVRELMTPLCSPMSVSLVCGGIIEGLSAVLAFLPQIAVLNVSLAFLEESGYISRLAAFSDDMFGKAGLNGKAVYTLLMGYGCTALAAMTAESLDGEEMKKKTAAALYFIPCSARTPVYMYFAAFCFKKYAFIVIAVIFFTGITLAALYSAFLNKFVCKDIPKPLICELAPLRMPKLKSMLKALLNCVKQFIIKLGSVITAVSLALWFFESFSADFRFLGENNISLSLLAVIGRSVDKFFAPIGVTDWRIIVAVICGLFAKEGMASALGMLYPAGIAITAAQGLALTVFTAFYTPCLTALASLKKETGFKLAFFTFTVQLSVAYLICILTYLLFNLIL